MQRPDLSCEEKLGKDDAEKDYQTKVLPALQVHLLVYLIAISLPLTRIQSRPDLFPTADHAKFYSYELYHIMGSRILSRSFVVERWQSEEDEDEENEEHPANRSTGSAMDIDEGDADGRAEGSSIQQDEGGQEDIDEGEEEDGHDSSDTAMVPMADMLNARFGCENVCPWCLNLPYPCFTDQFIRPNYSMSVTTSK